eukprot:1738841-Rhodomonas_salina.2
MECRSYRCVADGVAGCPWCVMRVFTRRWGALALCFRALTCVVVCQPDSATSVRDVPCSQRMFARAQVKPWEHVALAAVTDAGSVWWKYIGTKRHMSPITVQARVGQGGQTVGGWVQTTAGHTATTRTVEPVRFDDEEIHINSFTRRMVWTDATFMGGTYFCRTDEVSPVSHGLHLPATEFDRLCRHHQAIWVDVSRTLGTGISEPPSLVTFGVASQTEVTLFTLFNDMLSSVLFPSDFSAERFRMYHGVSTREYLCRFVNRSIVREWDIRARSRMHRRMATAMRVLLPLWHALSEESPRHRDPIVRCVIRQLPPPGPTLCFRIDELDLEVRAAYLTTMAMSLWVSLLVPLGVLGVWCACSPVAGGVADGVTGCPVRVTVYCAGVAWSVDRIAVSLTVSLGVFGAWCACSPVAGGVADGVTGCPVRVAVYYAGVAWSVDRNVCR